MQHIHMSTGFLFVLALFVVGLVAVILAYRASVKRDRLLAERFEMDSDVSPRPYREHLAYPHAEPSAADVAAFERHYAPRTAPPAPAYQTFAPVAPVYTHDPMSGLATGMILGSALSHHDHTTTIINNDTPSHHSVDSSSSSSYSPSSDSGFSYDSGSSSYDSGSSGGFDASF